MSDDWGTFRWDEVYLPRQSRRSDKKYRKALVIVSLMAGLAMVSNMVSVIWLYDCVESSKPTETVVTLAAASNGAIRAMPTPESTPTPAYELSCVACEPHGLPLVIPRGQKLLLTCQFRDPDRPGHVGVDFSAVENTEVVATMDGVVIVAGEDPAYGLLVVLQNPGWETWYGHNAYLLAREGDRIHAGDLLALSGNTGASSAPHVHYGVKDRQTGYWVNPEGYFGGDILKVELGVCIGGEE